jgi:hypothetical protein
MCTTLLLFLFRRRTDGQVHYATVYCVGSGPETVSSTASKDGKDPSRFSPIRQEIAYNQLHERMLRWV